MGAAPVPLTMTEGEREALAQCFRNQTKETVFAQLAAAARSVAGKEENTAAYLTAWARGPGGAAFRAGGQRNRVAVIWGEIWAKKGPPPLGQEPGAKGGGKERKRIWIKVKIGTGGGRF